MKLEYSGIYSNNNNNNNNVINSKQKLICHRSEEKQVDPRRLYKLFSEGR